MSNSITVYANILVINNSNNILDFNMFIINTNQKKTFLFLMYDLKNVFFSLLFTAKTTLTGFK